MAKKYSIQYQKKDYSFDKIIVEAESKREAVRKCGLGLSPTKRRLLLANCKQLNSEKADD
jgi:hypothetical protein